MGRFSESLAAALTARSTYETRARRHTHEPDERLVEQVRLLTGGNLVPFPTTNLRWYPADVETAMRIADSGDMSRVAQLWRACLTDGRARGVLGTRTGGLVRLPVKFTGPEEQVKLLQSTARGVTLWSQVFPPSELAAFVGDAIGIGVAIGELLPVEGRPHPVFSRLDPEFLRFNRSENQWYYRSTAGLLPITPGDGQWVMLTLGGRVHPWQYGLAYAVAAAWIDKLHARSYDNNWQSKLANPARVAESPNGATEPQREGWFNAVAAWGVNSVFEAMPGYKVSLLESNGRGHDAFNDTIIRSNGEIIVAIAGQEVTVDGGAGFQNGDMFRSIRADLIKETADGLAYCLNTQGVPPVMVSILGEKALYETAAVEYDVTPPKDKAALADAMTRTGEAITKIDSALSQHGLMLDIEHIIDQIGLRVKPIPTAEVKVAKLDLAPTDLAKVVRVDEARASQGLPVIGDERGVLTIGELDAALNAPPPAEENVPVT